MKKKLISVLLTPIMMFGMFPSVSVGAETEIASVGDREKTMLEKDVCRTEHRGLALISDEEAAQRQARIDGANGVMLFNNVYSETVYIDTVEDLLAIDGHKNGYYELTRDLSISAREWTPLTLYNATFNGNGHKISGMKITKKSSSCQATGFLAGSDNYISNLTLDSFKIDITDSFPGSKKNEADTIDTDVDYGTNPDYVVPLGSAYAHYCKLSGNVSVTANTDDQYLVVCGIYGGSHNEYRGNVVLNASEQTSNVYLSGLNTCSDSTFTGNVTANGSGVESGAIYNNSFWKATENCCFKGNVYVKNRSEGSAFLGQGDGGIQNCSFYGNIIGDQSDEVSSPDCYGFGAFYGTISDCALYGNVYNGGDMNQTAGFHSHGGRIENCRMKGNVDTVRSYGMSAVMGGVISSCVLEGNVSGEVSVCGMGIAYTYGANEKNGIVTNCSIHGDVFARSEECCWVWGINSSKSTTVRNCSVYGDVRAVHGQYGVDGYGIYGGYNNRINGDVIDISCGIYEKDGLGSSNVINGTVSDVIDDITVTVDKQTSIKKLFRCTSCGARFTGTERTYWTQCPSCETANSKLNGYYYRKRCAKECTTCIQYRKKNDYADWTSDSRSHFCVACDCAICDYCNPPLQYPDYENDGGSWDGGKIVVYRLGDSNSNSGTSYIPPAEPKDKEERFAIKIIEAISEAPVSGAKITADGKTYTTNENGIAFLTQNSCIDYLTVSTNGQMVYSESDFYAAPGEVNEIKVNGLTLSAEDFSFSLEEGTTVTGPEIQIAGQSVPIFDLALGFEFNIGENVSVSYDETNNTYKVIIGSDNLAANSKMTPEWREQYQKLSNLFRKKLSTNDVYAAMNGKKTQKGKLGIDAEYVVEGFLEVTPGSELAVTEGGIVVAAKLRTDTYYPIPAFPMVYFTFGLGGEVGGKINFVLETARFYDPKMK